MDFQDPISFSEVHFCQSGTERYAGGNNSNAVALLIEIRLSKATKA